jgi:hypothetical protein
MLWQVHGEAMTQPVGSPLQFVQRCGVLRRLESVVEVTGPWPVVRPDSANRKLPDEREQALKSRSRNRNPLDERERAPNRLRHQPPDGNARARGSSCGYPVLLHDPDPGLP